MNGVKHNPSETGTTSSVLRKHPFTTLAQSRNQFINVVTLASVHNARLNHGVKRKEVGASWLRGQVGGQTIAAKPLLI